MVAARRLAAGGVSLFALTDSALSSAVPTLEDLQSAWIDPNAAVSNVSATGLKGDQRDLATINNFWGSVGIAPEGVRPVDLFAVNSLELPPFAGCGATVGGFGCGKLAVNGKHLAASATRWTAFEAGRRATLQPSGLEIESATRMVHEENAVLWTISLSNPSAEDVVLNLDFDVAAPVRQYATVGKSTATRVC